MCVHMTPSISIEHLCVLYVLIITNEQLYLRRGVAEREAFFISLIR